MGKFKHGYSHTRLHNIWIGMRQRCRDVNTREYHRYGGRGISVCEEWEDFEEFRKWALANGYDENAPQGQCTLDRIDNDGNYEPSNCRWATMEEQSLNRPKRSSYYEYNGESHTLYEWANLFGIAYRTLKYRVKTGWSLEKALTTPIRQYF